MDPHIGGPLFFLHPPRDLRTPKKVEKTFDVLSWRAYYLSMTAEQIIRRCQVSIRGIDNVEPGIFGLESSRLALHARRTYADAIYAVRDGYPEVGYELMIAANDIFDQAVITQD